VITTNAGESSNTRYGLCVLSIMQQAAFLMLICLIMVSFFIKISVWFYASDLNWLPVSF